MKVAVTLRAADSVTVQMPVPEQPLPLQPLNVEPLAGAAVNVTRVPLSYASLQSEPQEIPDGELVTVPEPLRLTLNRYVVGTKVAVVVRAAVMETVQPPVPEQPPPFQPPNV